MRIYYPNEAVKDNKNHVHIFLYLLYVYYPPICFTFRTAYVLNLQCNYTLKSIVFKAAFTSVTH